MNPHVALPLLLCALCTSAPAAPLDPLLNPETLWRLTRDEFMTAGAMLGFEWTSSRRESARASGPGMTLLGLPVVEAIVRFGDAAPSEATAVLYARGDAGDLPEQKFNDLVSSAGSTLNQATNAKPVRRGRDPTNAVKADGVLWETEKARYLLEFSKTSEVKSRGIPFRAEFVRLEITPPEKKQGLLVTSLGSARPKFSGPAHVKKDAATGDVWIVDVPMVDQGQKGYCVVATAERVMRYYGVSADQQELAQAANTATTGGTNFEAMFDALKKLSARLKVRVREVERMEVNAVVKMIADYNRAAKRAGAPLIPDQGRMIDIGTVYRTMNANVLKEIRTRNKSDLSRFQRTVQSHVNEGTPLLWTVILGKIEERGIPQDAGGHMRLIIGYNARTEEILFSDSWGAGHELKRMPAADAWTITTGAMSIEPF
jgi:hypothetical protein